MESSKLTNGLHDWVAALVASPRTATIVTGADGRHLEFSDTYPAIAGVEAGRILELSLIELVFPPDRPKFEATQPDSADITRVEVRFGRAGAGPLVWVRLTGGPGPDGGRRYLVENVMAFKQEQLEDLAATERLLLAARGTYGGIWDWNVVTNEGYFSDGWCELLGYTRAELRPTYQTWVDLLHPEDRQAALRAIEQHLARQLPYDIEFRMMTRSGDYRWFRSRGQAVWNEAGQPVHMAGAIQDIHSRKLSDLMLEEWHNRYEAAISASGQVVYEWDARNDVTIWGGNIATLLGSRDAAGVAFSEWIKLIHPEDRNAVIAEYRQFMESRSTFRGEYRLRRVDGAYVAVEDTARLFRDASGEVTRVIGWVVDISERKRLETNLLEAKEGLEASVAERTRDLELTRQTLALALEGSREVVWDWSAPKLLRLTGPDASGFFLKKLDGQQYLEVHPDDDEEVVRRFNAHRLNETPLFESEHRVRSDQGGWVWVLARGKAVDRDASGHALRIVGTIADISSRKMLEEETRAALAAAEAANSAKSRFLANVSHEIRTPMNVMMGMSGLLLNSPLDPQQREYAVAIQKNAESLLVVINDILDFSKIEAGKLDISPADFDLDALIEDVTASLAPQARARGLELTVSMSAGVPEVLRGDAARVRQVLTNLVHNGVKFTHAGAVTLSIFEVHQPGRDLTLRFEVRDTGIGIEPEVQKRLFEPFTQADGSTTRQYGGTGLGLAISRRLVELMCGRIGLDSQPGRGSLVWFELPFETPSDRSFRSPECAELAGKRALIVARGERADTIARQLEALGLRTCVVAGTAAATAAFSQAAEAGDPFIAIAIDFATPELNGGELLAAAKISADRPQAEPPTVIGLDPADDEQHYGARANGAGVTVSLYSPVRTRHWLRALRVPCSPRDGERPTAASSKGRPPRILLVEDNPDSQRFLTRLVENMGCECDVASNGAEAIEMMFGPRYPLILMDCQMPVMDGFEATAAIREGEGEAHRTPIIAVTAHSLEGDRDKCLKAGMDDYVAKPVDASALQQVVERWMSASGRVKAGARSTAPNLEDLVPGYLADRERDAQALEAAAQAGDLREIKLIAHRMKGSGTIFGFPVITEIGRGLEKAAESRDFRAIQSFTRDLTELLGAQREVIR